MPQTAPVESKLNVETNNSINPQEPNAQQDAKIYSPQGEELKVWEQYLTRKKELMDSRKNVMGENLDDKLRRWDRNYFNREADIPALEIDPDQKPIAINNAFGKIQAALSIILDKDPKIILKNTLQKYSANRELIKQLAENSWQRTNSLGQLKLSVFNMAKRGWLSGRTFNKRVIGKAKYANSMTKGGANKYQERLLTKLNDIAYVNLDNRNVWFDEQARPEDMYSLRDAIHREVWHINDLRTMFPESEYPNMKFVKPGGIVLETTEGDSQANQENRTSQARELKRGMTEVYFYENQYEDWYIIEINKVMVIFEPLPQDHKRLSYITAPWMLRSAETIYGVGLVEAMERDETLIDRITNMTMRQLVLSINPPGFYNGPEDFENENIKIQAGVWRKVMDPKNYSFLQVPKPDKSNLDYIAWLEGKEDQTTGVTKRLEGQENLSGKDLAFEIGVSREASLKRLKLPLASLASALQWEFQNRVDLIKQTYSDFDVEHVANEADIMAYLDEVGKDKDFYFIENEGQAGKEQFYKKKYREFSLKLEKDDKDNFYESEVETFFKIKPQYLAWEGDIMADVQAMLTTSEEMEKADVLRMMNLLMPIFQLPIEIGLKPAKQILISFNKDPRQWLPDNWLAKINEKPKKEELSAPAVPGTNIQPEAGRISPGRVEAPKAESAVTATSLSPNVDLGQRFNNAYR